MATVERQREAFSPTPSFARRSKAEGNISAVFASFSGGDSVLPAECARLKRDLIDTPQKEQAIVDSFGRLLVRLQELTEEISCKGNSIIPQVQYADLSSISETVRDDIRQRGAMVVRAVAPDQSLEWECMLRDYIKRNPVSGFPKDRPQVFELYWSPAQMAARADEAVLTTHLWVNQLWNTSSDPSYPVDLTIPISYADRARMRNPGDRNFSLGPHSDCGSIELWENDGYRKCYQRIFDGQWEQYDPFDAALRDQTDTNLHNAVAYCGVFRTWQGWLSLSETGPGEGTLLVFPAVREATAYFVLRPFFKALKPPKDGNHADPEYLAPANWVLDLDSSTYPGSTIGKTQELTTHTHPHLRLDDNMLTMPKVQPGDYVFWHCEGIHAVEPVHGGGHDSSVLYLAACPLSARNAEHLREQRECLADASSGPDFPGGAGESDFIGVGTVDSVGSIAGRRALGLEPFAVGGSTAGAREARIIANGILFPSYMNGIA